MEQEKVTVNWKEQWLRSLRIKEEKKPMIKRKHQLLKSIREGTEEGHNQVKGTMIGSYKYIYIYIVLVINVDAMNECKNAYIFYSGWI